MRTEDGDEIIEPGVYELDDDKRLHVWITGGDEPQMWACCVYDHGPFCRLCQPVDGLLNACLTNVIDGRFTCSQKSDGEFEFSITQAGKDAVRAMAREDFDG